jgi:hypothetical protein
MVFHMQVIIANKSSEQKSRSAAETQSIHDVVRKSLQRTMNNVVADAAGTVNTPMAPTQRRLRTTVAADLNERKRDAA